MECQDLNYCHMEATSLSGYTVAPTKYNDLPITDSKRSKHASLVACLHYMEYVPLYFVR